MATIKSKNVAFQLISDHHFEYCPLSPEELGSESRKRALIYADQLVPTARYLLIAGDICKAAVQHYVLFLKALYMKRDGWDNIFLVLGETEYMAQSHMSYLWRRLERWKALAPGEDKNYPADARETQQQKDKLVILNRTAGSLEGGKIVVMGCTLWSRLRDDHRYLNRPDRSFDGWVGIPGSTAQAHRDRFEEDLGWLRGCVERVRRTNPEAKILIVTHYAPSITGTAHPNVDGMGDTWSNYQSDILGGEGLQGLRDGDVWVFGHTHFACDFRQDEVRILSAGTVTTARGDKGSIPLRSKPNVFIAALLSLSRTFDIRIDVNPGSTQSQPAQQFVPLPEPGMPASWFRMRSLPMEIRLMIDDLVTYFPIAGTNDSPPLFRTVKTGNYLTDLAWNSPRFDLRGDNLTLRPSDVAQYNSNTPPVNGRFLYLYRGIRLIYDRSASFGFLKGTRFRDFLDNNNIETIIVDLTADINAAFAAPCLIHRNWPEALSILNGSRRGVRRFVIMRAAITHRTHRISVAQQVSVFMAGGGRARAMVKRSVQTSARIVAMDERLGVRGRWWIDTTDQRVEIWEWRKENGQPFPTPINVVQASSVDNERGDVRRTRWYP